jgi:hypothetical protein
MFLGETHIMSDGRMLCHSFGGVFVELPEAKAINPTLICEDCKRRYRNITGTDLSKPEIDKKLLREKILLK